jgi:RNA polymerase sigma factor (sigma-70 family)
MDATLTPIDADTLARRYLECAIALASRQIGPREYKDEARSLGGEALAEAIRRYSPPADGTCRGFSALLFRVVNSTVVNFIRKRQTEVDHGSCLGQPERWDGKAYEVPFEEDEAEAFERRISPLRERLRAVMRLIYLEELTYREIAEKIGKSQGRVSQLHAEALAILAGGPVHGDPHE